MPDPRRAAPAERWAVVGDGTMGTALAHVMASAGPGCTLWCRSLDAAEGINRDHRHPARPQLALHPRLRATASLAETVEGASLVVVAVASGGFAETARALGGIAAPGQVLLSATKGIDLPSLRCMSDLLRDAAPGAVVGAIAGPNITGEIMAGMPTALVVASPSAAAREMAARALRAPYLRILPSDDLRSVELVSVLKNVVCVAAAIGAGHGMGFNATGLIVALALAEIRALGSALGAAADVFDGPAGVGDIFLTASSPQSLNRRLGMELGRGRSLDDVLAELPEVPEGIGAIRAVRRLAGERGLDLPICAATAAILEGAERPGALERILIEPETS